MPETPQQHTPVAVLAGSTPVSRAVIKRLRSDNWVTEDLDPAEPGAVEAVAARHGAIDGLVYDPGLLDGGEAPRPGEVVDTFLDLVENVRPHLRSREEGGARIVVVSSRDGLGWPDRPGVAAAAGALVAVARSLALQLGPQGITINVVAALPPEGSALRRAGQPAGTHLHEPEPLTPEPVTVDDIAGTAAFFLDARSGYITGQVLYCCGGASLLSSLSV